MTNSTLETLEQLKLYGVIDSYRRNDDGRYALSLPNGFPKVMTAAQVKAFASGALAVMRALINGQMKLASPSQFIPGQYNYGYTLPEMYEEYNARRTIPLETQS